MTREDFKKLHPEVSVSDAEWLDAFAHFVLLKRREWEATRDEYDWPTVDPPKFRDIFNINSLSIRNELIWYMLGKFS